MGLFDRPAPQQAVPGDLGGLRGSILQLLTGSSGQTPFWGNGIRASSGLGPLGSNLQPLTSSGTGGLLGQLGQIAGHNSGLDILGPLSTQFHQNLADALSQVQANNPHFSTGASYLGGQTAGHAINDYNVLASQVLQQGQDQQMRAILSLLGPALGPTFGGPFTQGSSPFESILGGISSVAGLGGLGGLGGLFGGGVPPVPGNLPSPGVLQYTNPQIDPAWLGYKP